MKKLYLVKGGLNKSKQTVIDETFFLITYDFKRNAGYIERKTKKSWRLYTTVGGEGPKYVGDKSLYHDFPTFEECVEKLKQLSKFPVEIIENYFKESEYSAPSETEKDGDYILVPRTDETILNQLSNAKFNLTPGAGYKLELYLESLKDRPLIIAEDVVNAMVFEEIVERHGQRLEQLRIQLDEEAGIIRPEDIPDIASFK